MEMEPESVIMYRWVIGLLFAVVCLLLGHFFMSFRALSTRVDGKADLSNLTNIASDIDKKADKVDFESTKDTLFKKLELKRDKDNCDRIHTDSDKFLKAQWDVINDSMKEIKDRLDKVLQNQITMHEKRN